MKKALVLVVLGFLAAAAVCSYGSFHFYYRAKARGDDAGERIRLLERAGGLFPWNAPVQFELGKAYFDRGVEHLTDTGRRDADFRKSFEAFQRSLRLDPGALQTHFQFAQSLLYMSYLSLPSPVSWFEEYKKSALLTGHNGQVFFEVGKVLLSRWSGLSPSERVFSRDILKRTLALKSPDRLTALLPVWEMNSRDYGLMDAILPDDEGLLRLYARFLGERSLSLEARKKALARAEALEFRKAQLAAEAGRRALDSFRMADAAGLFTESLGLLGNIRFYQSLTGEALFDPKDYAALVRSAYLDRAKGSIELDRDLAKARPDLQAYMDLEENLPAIGDLETFLRERGVLPSEPSFSAKDLTALVLQLRLSFRLNRYRDITRVGTAMEKGLVFVPEAMRPDLLEAYDIIGDAFQKLDYIYEAERFYAKALEGGKLDLPLLIKVRKGYERLNDEAGLLKADAAIRAALTPVDQSVSETIPKGAFRAFPLVLQGGRVVLELEFGGSGEGPAPLASVEFNGRVLWEGPVGPGIRTFEADTRTGANTLALAAVSGEVTPVRLAWRPI
jgi:hypothetical protein